LPCCYPGSFTCQVLCGRKLKTGVLEQWSIGVLIKIEREMMQIQSLPQYITPQLQHSITPATHRHNDIDKDSQID
ncbi:MAG: hypothetical protein OES70_02720, partial [Desulfobacterales bacterium]|nr:hypothetical protein [Desulfobacterales bacterium]